MRATPQSRTRRRRLPAWTVLAGALFLLLFVLAMSLGGVFTRAGSSLPDAGTWVSTASDGVGSLRGISALAPDDVWMVGRTTGKPTKALAIHWDGNAWTSKTVLTPGTSGQGDAYFSDVLALASDDVWAVGGTGESSPLLAHWDGKQWKADLDLALNVPIGELDAIDGSAPDDVWAVGNGRLAAHWDGSKWSGFPTNDISGFTEGLVGIDDVSPSDAWAVGSGSIIHWDGVSWTQTYRSAAQRSNKIQPMTIEPDFNDIAMLSATDGWVMGTDSPATDMPLSSLFTMHWDGKTWSAMKNKNGESSDSYNVCVSLDTGGAGCAAGRLLALSTNDVWAVGWHEVPLVSHWDGTAWQNDPCPADAHMGITDDGRFSILLPGFAGPLHDIAQVQPGVLWAVGDTIDGYGYVVAAGLQHGPCPTPVPTQKSRPRPTHTSPPQTPLAPAATMTVPDPQGTVPAPLPSGVIPNPIPSTIPQP